MNTKSSNPAAGGCFLIVFGLLALAILSAIVVPLVSKWKANAHLDERGRSAPAVLKSVERQWNTGERGGYYSYQVIYTFKPAGQPEQQDSVNLGSSAVQALIGMEPASSTTLNRPALVRFLPQDPSQNHLEGVTTGGSLLFGLLLIGVMGSVVVGIMVSGVRMMLPARLPAALSSENSPLAVGKAGRRVQVGSLTYIPLPDSAQFRPGLGVSALFLLFFGGFALLMGYFALSMLTAPFTVLFGLNIPGMDINTITINGRPATQAAPGELWGGALMGLVIPGSIAVLTGNVVVMILWFWRYPTTFDYAAGVFRCGGQEVCRLSDIREICVRRISYSNYPKQAKVGLSVGMQDGSWHRLDPRVGLLGRFGNQAKDPFTDLGELGENAQEEVRRVAAEVAARIGVPLNRLEEHGVRPPPAGK